VSFEATCWLACGGCALVGFAAGGALVRVSARSFLERSRRLWEAAERGRRATAEQARAREQARLLALCEYAVREMSAFSETKSAAAFRSALRAAGAAVEELDAAAAAELRRKGAQR
jgi:hypothetical protein